MKQQILGLSTNYIHTQGEKGTVLFLHGWGAPISLYQCIFDKLTAMGYGIAAFDMPGVGDTEEPKAPLTLQDYIDFTLSFCRAEGLEEVILMCHSHGGRIALSMLGDPGCPVKCRKAVLIDATGAPTKKSFKARASLRLYKAARILGTAKLTRPLFGPLYEELREKRSSADYKAASPVMRKTMSNVLPCDLTPVMPDITAQVLLIWGERDTATPLSEARVMESRIPGSGLAVIRGAGHFSFADNWSQFSAVLDAFL